MLSARTKERARPSSEAGLEASGRQRKIGRVANTSCCGRWRPSLRLFVTFGTSTDPAGSSRAIQTGGRHGQRKRIEGPLPRYLEGHLLCRQENPVGPAENGKGGAVPQAQG